MHASCRPDRGLTRRAPSLATQRGQAGLYGTSQAKDSRLFAQAKSGPYRGGDGLTTDSRWSFDSLHTSGCTPTASTQPSDPSLTRNAEHPKDRSYSARVGFGCCGWWCFGLVLRPRWGAGGGLMQGRAKITDW